MAEGHLPRLAIDLADLLFEWGQGRIAPFADAAQLANNLRLANSPAGFIRARSGRLCIVPPRPPPQSGGGGRAELFRALTLAMAHAVLGVVHPGGRAGLMLHRFVETVFSLEIRVPVI